MALYEIMIISEREIYMYMNYVILKLKQGIKVGRVIMIILCNWQVWKNQEISIKETVKCIKIIGVVWIFI